MNQLEILQQFCGDEESRRYPYITKTPFAKDGYLYATNGYALARVPTNRANDTGSHPPFGAADLDHSKYSKEPVEIPEVPPALPREKCDECKGTGWLHEVDCEVCKGKRFDICDLGHRHDCAECNGSGKMVLDMQCDHCNGTKLTDQDYFRVAITDSVGIRDDFARLLRQLGAKLYLPLGGPSSAIRFEIQGGIDGVVMPMMVRTRKT